MKRMSGASIGGGEWTCCVWERDGEGGGDVGALISVLVFRVSDGGLERKLVLVFLFLFSCCLRREESASSTDQPRADTYESSTRHATKYQSESISNQS